MDEWADETPWYDALPAFADWGVRLSLIGETDVREVLGTLPCHVGEDG